MDAVKPELVEKYTIFPLKKERSKLHLAMKDPNDIALVDELRFVLGTEIKGYIASEIRILYALEKYYGIKRDLRYVSILDEEKETWEKSKAPDLLKIPQKEDKPAPASGPPHPTGAARYENRPGTGAMPRARREEARSRARAGRRRRA